MNDDQERIYLDERGLRTRGCAVEIRIRIEPHSRTTLGEVIAGISDAKALFFDGDDDDDDDEEGPH